MGNERDTHGGIGFGGCTNRAIESDKFGHVSRAACASRAVSRRIEAVSAGPWQVQLRGLGLSVSVLGTALHHWVLLLQEISLPGGRVCLHRHLTQAFYGGTREGCAQDVLTGLQLTHQCDSHNDRTREYQIPIQRKAIVKHQSLKL